MKKVLLPFVILFLISNIAFAGNTPCAATVINYDLTNNNFLDFNTAGSSDSGFGLPGCGNYEGQDFWMIFTAPESGVLTIETEAGSITDAAFAVYLSACGNSAFLYGCYQDFNCGEDPMPKVTIEGLIPGDTYYIRLWEEFGGTGTFSIRLSDPYGESYITQGSAFPIDIGVPGVNCVQLTQAVDNQSGCAWYPVPLDFSQPFELQSAFNFGNQNGNGADGITLVFQPNGTNTPCGATGQGIGAQNIGTSWIVEFDTWDNGVGSSDIPQDHISINVNGQMGNALYGPVPLPNIEDGNLHFVSVKWNPINNEFSVIFDGTNYLTVNYNIVSNIFSGINTIYWGITSATGGSNNSQQFCLNAVTVVNNSSVELTVTETICDGNSVFAGGSNQTNSGTYTDVYTAANGCDSTVHTVVEVAYVIPDLPEIIQLDCEDSGDIEIDGSGTVVSIFGPNGLTEVYNYNISWSTNDGNIVSGSNTLTPTVNESGTYSLFILDPNSGCNERVDVEVITSEAPVADAGNAQQICVGNNVILNGGGTTTTGNMEYQWTTEVGAIASGANSLVPEVSAPGEYTLLVTDMDSGCTATASTIVTPLTVVLEDVELCPSQLPYTTQLNPTVEGVPFVVEWFPTTGLSDPNSVNPTVTITEPIIYTFTYESLGATNLITNGDFEQGNVGFTSELTYAGTGQLVWGTYNFSDSPTNLNSAFSNCQDFLGIGTEQIMVIDGIGQEDLEVWCQEVSIQPNTNYLFEAWGTTVNTSNPAELLFTFNGEQVGEVLELTNSECDWLPFELNWNSGNNTSIEICIINENGNQNGNDYAIDNISLRPYIAKTESITFYIDDTEVSIENAEIDCSNPTASLEADVSTSFGSSFSYEWTDSNGNVISEDETASVSMEGTYDLIVTNSSTGCTVSSSAMVTGDSGSSPLTAMTQVDGMLNCDTDMVLLTSDGSDTGDDIIYEWSNEDGATISDPNAISTEVNQAGTYNLIITNTTTGCTTLSTIIVEENNDRPDAMAVAELSIACEGTSSIELNADGSSTGDNIEYTWTTEDGTITSGENTTNPLVSSTGTYTLIVTNTDSGCSATANSLVNSLTVSVDQGENICASQVPFNTQLNATLTGTPLSYGWTPITGLDDPTALNPNVVITGPITYTFTALIETIDNLVGNNDFELGNSGFDTEYQYVPTPSGVHGIYNITDNPKNMNSAFVNCDDQSGNPDGMMLVADGEDIPNRAVWCQTLTVKRNAIYKFNTWAANVYDTSPAEIQLKVNNQNLSPGVRLPNNECEWVPVFGFWESGNNSVAEICIYDNSIVGGGNDFALDNISFVELCEVSETVTFDVDDISATANDGSIDCNNTSVTLTGEATSNLGTDFTYEWSNGDDTAEINVEMGGNYEVIITNDATGCTSVAAVVVDEDLIEPMVQIATPDMLGCGGTGIDLNGIGSSEGDDFTVQWTSPDGNPITDDQTLEPSVNAAGTYELLITDTTNGCTNSETITVLQDDNLPDALINTPEVLTCANSEISLDAGNSSTGDDISYIWSSDDGTIVSDGDGLNPMIDGIGTYTLLVTDASNGCTSMTSVNVTQNISPPAVNIPDPNDLDCIITSTNLSIENSDDQSSFSYVWSTTNGNILEGENTVNPSVDEAGTYDLLITNEDTGCTNTAQISVEDISEDPDLALNLPELITCDLTSISLNAVAVGDPDNFTYTWTTADGNILEGSETASPVINQIGTYEVIVTDLTNGCTKIETLGVNQDIIEPNVEAGDPQQLTCNAESLELAGASTTTGNINYQWSTPNGVISLGETSLNPTITAPGTYNLLVTNEDNGCTATDFVEISQDNNAPEVDAGPMMVLDCDATQLSLDASQSSTGDNIQIEWSTTDGNILEGEDSLNPAVDEAGTYLLTLTNTDNNCSSTSSVLVEENTDTPNAEISTPSELNCDTESITISSLGNDDISDLEFEWTSADGNINSSTNLESIELNEPGTYELLVTNSTSGCTAITDIEITQNIELPILNTSDPSMLDCVTPSINLEATATSNTGTLTYLWTTSDGNILEGATTLEPSVNQAGTYNLVVTNETNGCTATDFIEIAQNNDLPEVNVVPLMMLDCETTQLSLDGTQSITDDNILIEWTTSDGNILEGEDSLNPSVDEEGTYLLTLTNTNNNCSSSASVEVEQNTEAPIAEISSPAELNCDTESIIISSLGNSDNSNLEYEWTSADGNINSSADLESIELNEPGTYELLVSNTSNGCTALTDIEVTQNIEAPVLNTSDPSILDCVTPSINLEATATTTAGSLTYLWTTPDGNILEGATTLEPSVNQAGTYNLLVTNTNNNCQESTSIEVTQDDNVPIIAIAEPLVLDCENLDFQLDASGSSEGDEIQYEWTGVSILEGENTLTPTINQPGFYNLLITNELNSCTMESSIEVIQNIEQPLAAGLSTGIISCNVETVEVNANGSSEGDDFEYEWSTTNGNIISDPLNFDINVDQAGFYDLIVTNTENGCTNVSSIEVLLDENNPQAIVLAEGEITCDNNQVILNGNSSSQGANINFAWSTEDGNFTGGTNTLNPEVSSSGTYTLTIEDTNSGCSTSSSVEVIQNVATPMIMIATPEQLNCTNTSFLLDAGNSTPSMNINAQWTTMDGNIVLGATSLTPEIDDAGTYTLVITDLTNMCSGSGDIVVTEDVTPPNAFIDSPGQIDCMNDMITLDGSGTSSGSNFTYSWFTANGNIVNNETTLMPLIDMGGSYTLIVTNEDNNCVTTTSTNVQQNTEEPIIMVNSPSEINCDQTQTTLSGIGSSNGTNISYEWSTADGTIDTGMNEIDAVASEGGTYTLVVTNTTNNCTSSMDVSVGEDTTLPTASAGGDNVIDCQNPQINLDGTLSSSGPLFTFNWSTIDGSIVTGSTTVTPEIDEAGTYTLIVTNIDNGCTETDEVNIVSNADDPSIGIVDPADLTCVVTDVTIQINPSGGTMLTTEWTTSNGNIVSGDDTNEPIVDEPGFYEVVVSNLENGCTENAVIDVIQNTIDPTVDAGPPAELTCDLMEYTIQGSGSEGNEFNYSWTLDGNVIQGAATFNPAVDEAGTYTLLIVNTDNGCSASDDVVITENTNMPTDIAAIPTSPQCFGETGSIQFVNVVGGDAPYMYSIDGGDSFFSEELFPEVPSGTYDLLVEDMNGCVTADTIEIPIVFPIGAILEPEVTIVQGESYEINTLLDNIDTSNIQSITWSPDAGLSCSDCLNPIATPGGDLVYTINIVTDAGCETSASILFRVDSDIKIFIPNAFSPNNADGINDVFMIFAKDNIVQNINSLNIYDRWGDKVFELRDFLPNDPRFGWNGFYQNKKMNTAVFTYFAEIEFSDGHTEIFKGDVTLIE